MTRSEYVSVVLSIVLHGAVLCTINGRLPAPLPIGETAGPVEVMLVQIPEQAAWGAEPSAVLSEVVPIKKKVTPKKEESTSKVPPRSEGGGHSSKSASPVATEGGSDVPATAEVFAQYNPKPPYPSAARRKRHEGSVLLLVVVSATGHPVSVTVSQSSGFPELDESAVNTIRQWQFQPGVRWGSPVESTVEVPIRFQLKEE